ncbi:MAG: hypothetical protein M3Q03_18030 [Chloroflexota bacterium]|nr:hypothetical protein [Chloroflexota bacterium]
MDEAEAGTDFHPASALVPLLAGNSSCGTTEQWESLRGHRRATARAPIHVGPVR